MLEFSQLGENRRVCWGPLQTREGTITRMRAHIYLEGDHVNGERPPDSRCTERPHETPSWDTARKEVAIKASALHSAWRNVHQFPCSSLFSSIALDVLLLTRYPPIMAFAAVTWLLLPERDDI